MFGYIVKILLLVVFNFFKLGIHNLSIDGFFALRLGLCAALLGLLLGIDLLAQLLRGFHQHIGFGFDGILVAALQYLFGFLDRSFDFLFLAGIQLVAILGERLFHTMHHVVRSITRIHQFAQLLVFIGMRNGIFFHLTDFFLGQA